MTTPLQPRRLALIGAGRFSRTAHGPVLQRLAASPASRLTLDGVADVDEARPARARQFCKDFGVRAAYRSVPELIDRVRPDLLVCVVTLSRTASVVADLLPTKIPVIVEKPPGESAADAARLSSLSRACGTLHYVAFNRRRVPFIESARRWLRDQGPPRYAIAEMRRVGRTNPDFAVATGIHAVDTMRYLAGDVTWMEAASVPTGPSSRDYHASLIFESGCRGDIFLSMDTGVIRETYRFEYDDGRRAEVTMSAPYSDESIWSGFRVTQGDRVCIEEPAPADPLVAIGIVGEYDAFLAAVASGRQPDCTLLDAWKSMVVAEGMASGYRGVVGEPLEAVHPVAHRS